MSGVGLDSGDLLPNLAVRGSAGFYLMKPTDYALNQGFKPDTSKSVKTFRFSHDGTKLAWSNLSTVQIAELKQGVWNTSCTLDHPKVSAISWSPCSTTLVTWEPYAIVNGKDPKPNLNIWNGVTGELLRSIFQKQYRGWCPAWNKDETLCSRMVNNEIQFYVDNDFSKVSHKLHLDKVSEFAMSPNMRKDERDKTHVVAYAPGAKGAPGFCKLYQFPNFEQNMVLAHKSFFQGDSVEMQWNCTGTCCLLLIQADVDKTGNSYYGKQQLHGINTKGDVFMIGLTKEGPIYDASWCPSGKQFTVVYGAMPAKASLFNEKGDMLFDFGTGHKNMALYNRQGNILMIAGFGNLRGKIDMWNMSSDKPDHICAFEAPDQTDVKWCPDGRHIVTSTCAPRLRLDNGYKIWHYTGSVLHEKKINPPDELWEVDWQIRAEGLFPSFLVSKQPVQGIVKKEAPKQAYRPPQARGTVSTFTLHDNVYKSSRPIPGGVAGPDKNTKDEENVSKAALKNKRRRENAKKREAEISAQMPPGSAPPATAEQNGAAKQQNNDRPSGNKGGGYQGAAGLLYDPEVEKKKKKLTDKLNAIQALKQQQAEGKTLEKNQLEKIAKESEMIKDLEKLSIRK
jgi:translation initiation factor 2A